MAFISLELKVVPRSEIVLFGKPCSFQTFVTKRFASSLAVWDSLQGMKCAILENRSTTTMMLSDPLDFGNFTTKSKAMSSHGPFGISRGFTGTIDFDPFVRWQVSQDSTYLFTLC